MATQFETLSPGHLKAEESGEHDASLDLPVDYLNPMSFIDMDPMTWAQQSISSDDPTLEPLSYNPLGESNFDYNFTFGGNYFGLPSPPNSNSSFDPPSPSNGFASSASSNPDVPLSLDPTLTNSSSVVSSVGDDNNASTGAKRKGDSTRPKTSHTTIERRYRNNLNTRMTGLRQAVPALRVLDKIAPPSGVVDVVDERGIVDGVRAAKKSSKSTILGKATEYIMVLKRRENRLRTELQALKMFFIENVPNGADMLVTWEVNHYSQFGGEQSDELSPQDTLDEDDEDDEEGPRPAKKAKTKASEPVKQEVKKVTAPAPVGPNGEPLKRKRGRPRKIPVTTAESMGAPVSTGESHFSVIPRAPNTGEPQPARYLLTAFVFFTFLGNLPSSSNSFTDTRNGMVLNQLPTSIVSNFGWWDASFVRIAQLVTSLLLFLSLLAHHFPNSLQSYKLVKLLTVSSAPTVPSNMKQPLREETIASKPDSKVQGLGTLPGIVGECIRSLSSKGHSAEDVLFWKRMTQKLIIDDTSLLRRVHAYIAVSSIPGAAAERALLGFPLFPSSATKQWAQLAESDNELRKTVFSRSIEDTLQMLESIPKDGLDEKLTLEDNLIRIYLSEGLASESASIFSSTVSNSPCRNEGVELLDLSLTKKRLQMDGGSLGADIKLLFEALEDLESTDPVFHDLSEVEFSGRLSMARDLIQATQLFKQLFPNRTRGAKAEHAPLSPPPSPSKLSSRRHHKRKHELRCLLGRATFDHSAVDEARDVLVDLLTRS